VHTAEPHRRQIICQLAADPRGLTITQKNAIVRGALNRVWEGLDQALAERGMELAQSRVASISLCMRAAANTPVEPLGACFAHFPSDNSRPLTSQFECGMGCEGTP
jgi:hypothetical protein